MHSAVSFGPHMIADTQRMPCVCHWAEILLKEESLTSWMLKRTLKKTKTTAIRYFT